MHEKTQNKIFPKQMGKKKTGSPKYVIPILVVCFVVLLFVMMAALGISKHPQSTFVPPPFETAAKTGIPDVPDSLGYSEPYQAGMNYRFGVCANVNVSESKATVFFTNPEENTVWLKIRVLDENNELLGESGLLRPGEYVQYVTLSKELEDGTPIQLKIMGYEPDTYYSAGAATVTTTANCSKETS